MLTELMLRKVPDALRASVGSGEFRLWGSVIRDGATGQIRGFLQETGLLDQVIGKALDMGVPSLGQLAGGQGGLVTAAVDAVGFAITARQNSAIQAAVSTVQHLQVANLALTGAGIGVSVAGFAVLAHKLGVVEAKVDLMADKLDRIARGVEALKQEPIRQDFTRLRTAAKQLDEGWRVADPVPEWRQTARDAGALADSFERRVGELLDAEGNDPTAAEPFLQALALAQATHVTARVAMGDDAAARHAAAVAVETLVRLGERMRPAEAALARVGDAVEPGTTAWAEALKQATTDLRPTITAVREREAAAASSAATLIELKRQGIGGRAWLEAARDEEAEPLLCLLPAP